MPDDDLDTRRRSARVPGLAVCVQRRGAPAVVRGLGLADLDDRRAVQPRTVFAWYSLTKIVTATVALQLVEQGRLELDEPVVGWVPEWSLTDPSHRRWRHCRVRDLLCHGSGLVDRQRHVARWFREPGTPFPEPRAFLARQLGAHGPRRRAPGARLHYSNLGYAVLGEVLAAADGRPFRDLVRARVLDPLGLVRTTFEADHTPASLLARGYLPPWSTLGLAVRLLAGGAFTEGRTPAPGPRLLRVRWRDLVFSPHGGLLGPIDELARFLALHLHGGAIDGVRVLTPESVEAMARPVLRHGRAGRAFHGCGLGWFVDERPPNGPVLSHGGRGPGFTTEMRVLPRAGLALGVLGNSCFDAKGVLDALGARPLRDAQVVVDRTTRAR